MSTEKESSERAFEYLFKAWINSLPEGKGMHAFSTRDVFTAGVKAGRDSVTTDKMIQNPANVSNKQRLGEWREGHYSSEIIAAMVKEAFERGMESRELNLPDAVWEGTLKQFTGINPYSLFDSYNPHYPDIKSKYRVELYKIKALNECDGESGEKE